MAFVPTERLHLGAEAEVWAGTWMGLDAVRKLRRPRKWRHPDLDIRLGYRRMMSESRLLIRLKRRGVNVPAVWDLDPESGRIILERMPGLPLIEILRSDEYSQDFIDMALRNTGALIRRLHREAITHGDLSTNNILVDENANPSLIDFGLAAIDYEIERFGIDLHVIDEILGASHPEHKAAIDTLLEGYASEEERLGPPPEQSGGAVPTSQQVLKRLEDVRSRVRYHG
jgi:TP53 regulating kinase-like protein